jgi:hypothetical protein
MTFNHWLDTFVDEKELDREQAFDVEGPEWGWNHIPLQCVLDAIKAAPQHEQAKIKTTIVRIDFANGDVMDFFKHLAGALAR